jgi:hypothetical protein
MCKAQKTVHLDFKCRIGTLDAKVALGAKPKGGSGKSSVDNMLPSGYQKSVDV